MATLVERFRVNDQEYYIINQTVAGCYISPPFRSREELAEYAVQQKLCDARVSIEDWMEDALDARIICEINPERMKIASDAITALQSGEEVSKEQAVILYELYKFTDPFNDYSLEVDSKLVPSHVVEQWIDELGMRDDYDQAWNADDILDQAISDSYVLLGMKEKQLCRDDVPIETPTANERRLAGLHLEARLNAVDRLFMSSRRQIGETGILGITKMTDDE